MKTKIEYTIAATLAAAVVLSPVLVAIEYLKYMISIFRLI